MPLWFYQWLLDSPWAYFMNNNEWAFPAVQSLHFIGFALSVGTIVIVDCRLLGVGMLRQTAAELDADLAPWTFLGVAVMLTTGMLMFSADAVTYHFNPSFQFKMVCLTLALIFHYTLHGRVVRPGASPILAKLAAVTSITLWTMVV